LIKHVPTDFYAAIQAFSLITAEYSVEYSFIIQLQTTISPLLKRRETMQTVNIHEAQTHFSRFVQQAEAGEEIVISRAGKPVARLTGLSPSQHQSRKLGLGKGKFTLPENVDNLASAEITEMFEHSK
jgi:prevent-host-death family protein